MSTRADGSGTAICFRSNIIIALGTASIIKLPLGVNVPPLGTPLPPPAQSSEVVEVLSHCKALLSNHGETDQALAVLKAALPDGETIHLYSDQARPVSFSTVSLEMTIRGAGATAKLAGENPILTDGISPGEGAFSVLVIEIITLSPGTSETTVKLPLAPS